MDILLQREGRVELFFILFETLRSLDIFVLNESKTSVLVYLWNSSTHCVYM